MGAGGGQQEATPLVWNNTIYGITNFSIVFAVDARTGREKWRWDPVTRQARWTAPVGAGIGGGTMSSARNLVFQVSNQGHLIVYSADKGDKLIDINTGLRGGMGPPITYQVDGKTPLPDAITP